MLIGVFCRGDNEDNKPNQLVVFGVKVDSIRNGDGADDKILNAIQFAMGNGNAVAEVRRNKVFPFKQGVENFILRDGSHGRVLNGQ